MNVHVNTTIFFLGIETLALREEYFRRAHAKGYAEIGESDNGI